MKPVQLHSVFHPSDFSRGDEPAFMHALRIAHSAKAELTLLHVDSPDETAEWSDFPSVRATLTAWGMLAPGATKHDVEKTGLHARKIQRHGKNTAEAIQAYVADEEPDLVVLATHQRTGLSRWLHQAVAEPIARATPAMTLFVPRRVQGLVKPETGRSSLRTILIPVDTEPHPQRAVDAAALFARTLGGGDTQFLILHAGPEANVPGVAIPGDSGWTWDTQAWPGPAVDHILSAAEANDADLIVMAKRGQRSFLDALRGTTTERVVRGARCPVLTVPVA